MKIAVIDPSLFTIPYDDALCDALAGLGCEPVLYGRRLRPTETRSGSTSLVPFFYRFVERRPIPLPLRAFRMLKGLEHAADMLRLRRRLAAAPPDVIHFQWAPLPVVDRRLIPAFRRIAPVVLTVHDTTPFNGSPNAALQEIGALAIFAAFDHLIVHTETGRAQLVARGIPAAKVSVIPHGALELPGGGPLPDPSPRRGREGSGIPSRGGRGSAETQPSSPSPLAGEGRGGGTGEAGGTRERVILAFGKIKPYKGIDLLIEAYAALPEALRRGARLRIVGEPFMPLEPLQNRARELGIADRIEWDARYVRDDEIGGILNGADILAFPYRQIDASGVLMIGLRYGKPIVASALGAFAELLRDGEHGRLVPPGEVAALRDALAGLLADPARAAAMGENVRRIADGIAGWPEIADRTLSLYRRLVAQLHKGAAPAESSRDDGAVPARRRPI